MNITVEGVCLVIELYRLLQSVCGTKVADSLLAATGQYRLAPVLYVPSSDRWTPFTMFLSLVACV